jgi:ABC-type glycerol-3-phosphate transport system permease component
VKTTTILGKGSWGLYRISMTLLTLFPFIFIIILAFKSLVDIYINPLSLNSHWVPGNFSEAWGGPPGGTGFSVYTKNSAIVVLIAIPVSGAVGALAAYFTTLLVPSVRKRFLAIPLMATMLPSIVLLIPFFQIFNALGILSNPGALGLLYAGLSLPVTILVLHAFFLEFPKELLEAAALDGLNRYRTFTKIVIRLSISPILAVSLLNLIWVWGETQIGLVLLVSRESQTIPVGILTFQSALKANPGPIFAGLTLATIPLILIYLAFHRVINRGISMGGVIR